MTPEKYKEIRDLWADIRGIWSERKLIEDCDFSDMIAPSGKSYPYADKIPAIAKSVEKGYKKRVETYRKTEFYDGYGFMGR
jgi:hypothetical protein